MKAEQREWNVGERMATILIVEDDVSIHTMIREYLRQQGFSCLDAYSGSEALLVLDTHVPDLVLLDLMLPGLPGEEVLPKIQGIPVIVVSAKVGIDDKVSLLLGGAADYVTKPFDVKELLARVAVQLRQGSDSAHAPVYEAGDLRLDTLSHETTVGGVPVYLTKTEYAILKLLLQHSGKAIAKAVILDRISEDTPDCTDNSLKQHVSNLRQKLRDAGGKDYIEAVWGIGFKLTES